MPPPQQNRDYRATDIALPVIFKMGEIEVTK